MLIKKLFEFNKYPARLYGMIKRNLKVTITGVQTSENVIALTFDDGPHPEHTPEILDLLDKYQAKATFFLVGESVEKYPSIVDDMAKKGHAIGNHTWSHQPVPLISRKERIRQVRNTEELLPSNGQKLFRPPWGFLTLSSYIDIKLLGYKFIFWDMAANDWADLSAEEIFSRLDTKVKPGSFILMHDTLYHARKPEYRSRKALIQALGQFLEKYHTIYKFVTVTDLLQIGKPIYEFGINRKSNAKSLIPGNMNY